MKKLSILNSTLDGIVVINRKGIIDFCNHAAYAMFGYAHGKLEGLAIEVLLPEAIRQAHIAQRDAYIHKPEQRIMNQGKRFTALRQDGSEFPVAISLNPTTIDDEEYICASIQDLTQLEEEAEKLEKSQKMEALGEMVAGIAHNFNNVLAGLSGQAYLLNKQEQLSAKGFQRIESINSLCDQAANIIKQLLVYARNQDDTFHHFELTSMTHEVVDVAQATAPQKITIEYNAPDCELPIHGAKSQIQQTLLNLINNAIYAIGDTKGKITISTMHCEGSSCGIKQCGLNRGDANSFVCIRVQDTGKGIAEKDIRRIFDPFFSTKPQGQGTGLGLSTSYGIIRKHHGEISVSSKSNCGTMFQIFLPISSDVQDTIHQALTTPTPASKRSTILIIDDEQAICSMLAEILSSLGYNTLTASNGKEGVTLFLKHPNDIALIISDISMPELNGDEVMNTIRNTHPNIPFLFMTGHQDPALEASILDNSTQILLKPFDFINLSKTVAELIDQNLKSN